MMMPPMHMIGVDTIKFRPISTSIWTCWTSFVPRVIRVGAPKRVDVLGREAGDLAENVATEVAAHRHGCLRAEVHAGNGGAHLDKCHKEHDGPGTPDEIGVAPGNAFVNDLGVEAGQVEGRNGGRQLEGDDSQDVRQIRFGVTPYEGDEHAHGSFGRARIS